MKNPHYLTRLRNAALPGLPLWVFLSAYFSLTVLGNLLYGTSFGADLPAANIKDFSWDKLHTSFGIAFWLLLFLPFLLAPIAFVVKQFATPVARSVAPIVPELSKPAYLVITIILYIYVINALTGANALDRLLSGNNAILAVESRFALLADIGFEPQVAMKSLLVFLTVYGAIKGAREPGIFWQAVTCINVIVLTTCLILLNMKWPAVVFILTLGICVAAIAKKRPYLKSITVTASGILVYFMLATVLLRWFPAPQTEADLPTQEERYISHSDGIKINGHLLYETVAGSLVFAPRLAIGAINRMAMAVPYYFDFSEIEGPSCGQELSRLWIKRDLACEPTLLVYTRMFGDDGFAGRGTAPASVNIYGYALAGWAGAIVSTIIAIAVLGLFLALWAPAQTNAVVAAAFIMGSYTAYFMSQLPIEGPIIYDHGMLWWALLVMAWTAAYWTFRLLTRHLPSRSIRHESRVGRITSAGNEDA